MSRDIRNYRAIYQRVVDLAEEWEEYDDTDVDHSAIIAINQCGRDLAALLLIREDDPEPKHAARPPHPNTMAGR